MLPIKFLPELYPKNYDSIFMFADQYTCMHI